MTEKQIRNIVKSVLRSQFLDVPDKSEVNKIASDSAEKAVKKAFKNAMTEKEVKKMIKKTMLSYHRWMWEKKSMWMSQI